MRPEYIKQFYFFFYHSNSQLFRGIANRKSFFTFFGPPCYRKTSFCCTFIHFKRASCESSLSHIFKLLRNHSFFDRKQPLNFACFLTRLRQKMTNYTFLQISDIRKPFFPVKSLLFHRMIKPYVAPT